MSLTKSIAASLRNRKLIDDETKATVDAAIESAALGASPDPKTVSSVEDLPSFRLYVAAQHAISCFGEHVFDHPKLVRQNNEIAGYDEEYMPSYPPHSPVTSSFATATYLYDYPLGRGGETVADLFTSLDVLAGRPAVLAQAVRNFAESRCGIYEIASVRGHLLRVVELHTGERFDAVCGSGYVARAGELWLCRFVPALGDGEDFEVAITTPYVLTGQPRAEYEAFLDRQRLRLRMEDAEELLTRVFKRPRHPAYWLEYVLQAYATHSGLHIELTGVPDVAGTKPHEDGGKVLQV